MSNYSGPYLAPNGLPWLSASQVEGFADCERKWGLRYLKKLKHQDPSAALGARIHEIAEAWLKEGTPPNEAEALTLPDKYHESGQWTYYPGQIFKSGMHMLKHAVAHTPKIEGFFRFKSNVEHEIYWQGAKDLSWVSDRPWVGDHKSSKNPKRYGKNAKGLTPGWQAEETHAKSKGNPTRLLCDTQAMLYSYEAQETHGAKDNGLGWFYYPTRPSNTNKPNAVEVIAPRDHVLEQVARIEGIAKRTLQMYKEKPDPKTLPFNRDMCDGFGGCPFKGSEHCDAHKTQIFNFFGDSPMSSDSGLFTDFINKQFPSQVVPPPPPAPPVSIPLTIPGRPDLVGQTLPVQKSESPDASGVHAYGVNIPPPPPPMPPMTLDTPEEQRAIFGKAARPLTEESDDTRTHDFLAQTIGAKAADRIIGQVKKESVIPPPPAPPINGGAPLSIATHGLAGIANLGFAQQNLHAQFAAQGRPMVGGIGVINSPESPLYAPASPEESQILVPVINTSATPTPDVLDTMDRAALKALNIRLGLCTDSSRFQEPKLRANIREYAQSHGIVVEDLVAGPSVDSSEPSVDVLSPDMLSVLGEQLEANRSLDVGLTSEEREAVSAASQVVGGMENDHFAAIRAIIREELGAYFAERFGK